MAEDWAIVGEVRAASGKSQDSRARDEENGQQVNRAGLPLAVRVEVRTVIYLDSAATLYT